MYADPETELEIELDYHLHNPRIFYLENSTYIMNWVAEGSDGRLYIVPAEPGGWLRRNDYRGSQEDLVPLSTHKATTIAWYVYGDVGKVTIACG